MKKLECSESNTDFIVWPLFIAKLVIAKIIFLFHLIVILKQDLLPLLKLILCRNQESVDWLARVE